MTTYPSNQINLKPLLAGGLLFIFVALLIDMRGSVSSTRSQNQAEVCQGETNTGGALSRDQIARLLTVPERNPKSTVRDILKEPYCKLSSLQVRAGVEAERDAYRLSFEQQTWLIVLYEGDEYAGYQFRIQ